MSDINHTTSPQNSTNEDEFNIVELVKNLTILSGVDWDKLSEEKQEYVFENTVRVIGEYLEKFFAEFGDVNAQKHLKMIQDSNMNTKLIEKYPEVRDLFRLGIESLIRNFMEKSKNTSDTDEQVI